MSFTTHLSILSGVRRRQDESCERFYRAYAPLIRLHGRDCGITGVDLDDLVQMVLIGFFQQPEFRYDAERGNFRNYLRKLIRAKSCDLLRAQYRRQKLHDAMPKLPEAQIDRRFDAEYRHCLFLEAMRVLKKELQPLHYQLFAAYIHYHTGPGVLASRYGLPKPTVYSILRRAEAKLTALLRQLAADPHY